MDAGTLIVIVLVATALVAVITLSFLWRREKNRPYTYGPGLLGLSKDDLGTEEPDRDKCYMCGRPQRGWQPFSLACPECGVRYCFRCRNWLDTRDRMTVAFNARAYNTCRYCGFASHKWNRRFR